MVGSVPSCADRGWLCLAAGSRPGCGLGRGLSGCRREIFSAESGGRGMGNREPGDGLLSMAVWREAGRGRVFRTGADSLAQT